MNGDAIRKTAMAVGENKCQRLTVSNNRLSETEVDLETFIANVVQLTGYEEPVPQPVRILIQQLKSQGYSVSGAAKHVRTFLEINEFKS